MSTTSSYLTKLTAWIVVEVIQGFPNVFIYIIDFHIYKTI